VAIAAPWGLPGAQAASGSQQTLASVMVRSPIGAYGGWVVWSAPVSGGWGLDAYHAGEVKALRMAPRAQPFDVDLGTDAAGEVVATFSRCVKSPTYSADLFLELEGVDCRVHVLNLASERERTPAITHPAGTSDTTPSMWDGNIAFARFDPRHHADVAQLLLWSGRTHGLRVLRHGATPTTQPCPPAKSERGRRIHESKEECLRNLRNSIKGAVTKGAIESVDLGPDLVSFLWKIDGPGVISTGGGWEVRADRLATGASLLAGSGFHGDVCMAGIDGSVLHTHPLKENECGTHSWPRNATSTQSQWSASTPRPAAYPPPPPCKAKSCRSSTAGAPSMHSSRPHLRERSTLPAAPQHHARSSACRYQSSNSKSGSHSHHSPKGKWRDGSSGERHLHRDLAPLPRAGAATGADAAGG
jgi:hypothetical protein